MNAHALTHQTQPSMKCNDRPLINQAIIVPEIKKPGKAK
jgi:hypothetical protein